MPRPLMIRIMGPASRRRGMWYSLRLTDVARNHSPPGIRIEYRDTSPDQEGRTDSVILSTPVRPNTLGASLFQACSIDIHVGAEINATQIEGCVIQARFDPATNQPVEFKKPPDEQKPEPVKRVPESPTERK